MASPHSNSPQPQGLEQRTGRPVLAEAHPHDPEIQKTLLGASKSIAFVHTPLKITKTLRGTFKSIAF